MGELRIWNKNNGGKSVGLLNLEGGKVGKLQNPTCQLKGWCLLDGLLQTPLKVIIEIINGNLVVIKNNY